MNASCHHQGKASRYRRRPGRGRRRCQQPLQATNLPCEARSVGACRVGGLHHGSTAGSENLDRTNLQTVCKRAAMGAPARSHFGLILLGKSGRSAEI
jgi:hypothetical protein